MNLIAAVDLNWAIGRGNELLIRIPNDHKQFRLMTEGNVVVYGRRTLETFPQKMPLPSRTNIVLSKDPAFRVKGADTVHSLEELLNRLREYREDEIFIIGGESVYAQMLPYCNTAHITRIDRKYQADRYFPNLDEDAEWSVSASSDEQSYFDTTYTFVKYERKAPALLR